MSPPDMEVEDSKAGSLNSENGGKEFETRFADLCQEQLSLDENTISEAMKLLRHSKRILFTNMPAIAITTPEELDRYLFAFVVYSVKRLRDRTASSGEQANHNGVALCQILRAVKLNLVDFLKELPHLVFKVGSILSNMYGADWEKRLEAKELHANFVHLNLLSKFYKRAYLEFFKINGADTQAMDASSCSGYISDVHKFGWLLFLALRVHAFGRFKDLVTCTNGLVSVLAILIIHIPTHLRSSTILDSSFFERKNDRGVDLIASLCCKYDTSEDEVKSMMGKSNDLITCILEKKPCSASECENENLSYIDPEGLIYFEDLLEESSLPSNISKLECDYDAAPWNKSDIDERVFLNVDDRLLGSGSFSEGVVHISGAKRNFDTMASPTKTITSPLSPSRSPAVCSNDTCGNISLKAAATPVSITMTNAKWIRAVISPLPPKPSAQLEKYFKSCEKDVSNEVVRRAHIILEAIFPNSALGERCGSAGQQSANLMDNIWAQQRRLDALKLYYRVLEAICIAEAQLLHANNLTSLLTNERFHRCMLACSAELILATQKTVTMLFPAILEKTGITAFDLSKVIECFIRHEDSLPRELRRHLNSLEERLLESMVWEKGSSMYNSLIIARPALSAEIHLQGLLAEPMPSLDAIAAHINMTSVGLPPLPSPQKQDTATGQSGDIRSPNRFPTEYRSALVDRKSFTSPVKDRLINNLKQKLTPPALQCAFASPTRPSAGAGGETCAESGISIFFSKIMKLAAVRINSMVDRLQLPQQFRESVYDLFRKILNQQTSVFFNRHIDQIILCSFYGVAKISQLSLTFKEIILNYRKQHQCKPLVFQSVFVDWSSARGNMKQRQDHVDIITFYNEIFIPSVKPLLVELCHTDRTSVNRVAASDNDKNAQCPGSPKVSTFPSLPDMSPKKISSVHNIYVSPLRSSKMDALVSNSPKSYYACIGESTRAYQSPSKDLTAINNCLNSPISSTRRIRGALNLDADVGLVSDSVVANSLYLPSRSCTPSSLVLAKIEQPDL